jgi:hypothetical protein
VQQAVQQAMVSAGLPADAPALDFDAFLRMLSADVPEGDTEGYVASSGAAGGNSGPIGRSPGASLQKYASLAQRSVAFGDYPVSLSGVVRRACSTHLLRGLSVSQALSGGLSEEAGEAAHEGGLGVSSNSNSWSQLWSPRMPAKDAGSAPIRAVRSRGVLAAVAEDLEDEVGGLALQDGGSAGGGVGGGRRVGGGFDAPGEDDEDADGSNPRQDGRIMRNERYLDADV